MRMYWFHACYRLPPLKTQTQTHTHTHVSQCLRVQRNATRTRHTKRTFTWPSCLLLCQIVFAPCVLVRHTSCLVTSTSSAVGSPDKFASLGGCRLAGALSTDAGELGFLATTIVPPSSKGGGGGTHTLLVPEHTALIGVDGSGDGVVVHTGHVFVGCDFLTEADVQASEGIHKILMGSHSEKQLSWIFQPMYRMRAL